MDQELLYIDFTRTPVSLAELSHLDSTFGKVEVDQEPMSFEHQLFQATLFRYYWRWAKQPGNQVAFHFNEVPPPPHEDRVLISLCAQYASLTGTQLTGVLHSGNFTLATFSGKDKVSFLGSLQPIENITV